MKVTGLILIIASIIIFALSIYTNAGIDRLPPENYSSIANMKSFSPGWLTYAGAFSMAVGIFLLLGRKTKI